jgi:hypothetical protein
VTPGVQTVSGGDIARAVRDFPTGGGAGGIAKAVYGFGNQPAAVQPAAPAAPVTDTVFTASEKYRYDNAIAQGIAPEQATIIAKRPGDFLAYAGSPTNPQQIASFALADSVAFDERYSPEFRKAVSLGQRPSPGTGMTMRDLQLLNTNQLGFLQSIVGEGILLSWMGELQAFTPRGVSTAGAQQGGVRLR